MWGNVFWTAAITAFICDVATDLLFGNATANVITFIAVFCIAGLVRLSMLANHATRLSDVEQPGISQEAQETISDERKVA